MSSARVARNSAPMNFYNRTMSDSLRHQARRFYLQDGLVNHITEVVDIGRKWIHELSAPVFEFGYRLVSPTDRVFARRAVVWVVSPRKSEVDEVVLDGTGRPRGVFGLALEIETLIWFSRMEHTWVHDPRVVNDVLCHTISARFSHTF